jgi:hypothetical protein
MKREYGRSERYLILGTTIILLVLVNLVMERLIPTSFDKITGDVISRVNITQTLEANCNFTLSEGSNLVSFFCIPNAASRNGVIGSLESLEAVFEYQEGQADSWKTYNPHLPAWAIQDLNLMSRTKGYWIRMSNNESFFLAGGLRVPTNIPLQSGWNLAGYPANRIKGVNESFLSIEGNFTEVRTYLPISGTVIGYVPGIGGALNQTEPYYGYWINATVSGVWVVG